jgi:hypothetical protein
VIAAPKSDSHDLPPIPFRGSRRLPRSMRGGVVYGCASPWDQAYLPLSMPELRRDASPAGFYIPLCGSSERMDMLPVRKRHEPAGPYSYSWHAKKELFKVAAK